MSIRKIQALFLAGLTGLLAGCATPAVPSVHEDLVYFETPDGKYEKFATILSRSPGGRSVFFVRSPDGKSIAVCAGQPGDANDSPNPPTAAPVPTREQAAQELLQTAFFQNCIARANGFIDASEFTRTHRALVDAVSRHIRSVTPK